MIKGIGLDLIEIERVRTLYERKASFANRILTKGELEHFTKLSNQRKIEFLAGRFSAKEAFAKALGCGIGKECSFQDIDIKNDEKGKPMIHSKITKEMNVYLSITHTSQYAAAQVIIED